MAKNTQAVIFDFDGTLVDSMGLWREVDLRFFSRRGLNFDEMDVHFGGMSFSECAAYAKELLGLEDSLEEIKQEWTDLSIELYEQDTFLKPFAKEFVGAVKASGLRTAIGTSNNQSIIQPVLSKYGMTQDFDLILTCCEVGRGKPAPDVYLNLADALKVKPADCVVFEDTLEGVLAGKSAGMFVYAVEEPAHDSLKHEIQKACDRYISGFGYFRHDLGKIREIL